MVQIVQHPRRTKILATLGPGSHLKIRELILAGVNVFRLNFSHIENNAAQVPIINEIRKHSEELQIPVGILGDLCGPKIRCNAFGSLASIDLLAGQEINLVCAPSKNEKYSGSKDMIVTPIPQIIKQSKIGHRILLDDGYIKLTVKDHKKFELEGEQCDGLICVVENNGNLKPKKGINCPDLKLDLSALTEKDKVFIID
jgi:pyruvate kinase